MTLEGAINLNETNDYIIYTMNSVTTGQYGVVVPKNVNVALNMLVDLHMKSSFDCVGNGTKTKEQLVAEISDEYGKLKNKYAEGMLVLPMIDEVVFQSTVLNGDKQKMFDEVKKIGAITSELYKKLTDSGVDKQKIDQKIIVVEKTSEDEKFVSWLKEQMPNFVDGVLYSELNAPQVVNPFVSSDSVFGTSPVTPAVEPVAAPVSDSVATTVPPVSIDLFGNNAAQVAPSAPVTPIAPEPVATTVSPASTDLFGNNTAQVAPNPVAASAPVTSVVSEPVVQPAPIVEGPKPVESTMLEGTVAFTPIPNHPNNPVENVENAIPEKKGSKGFVNLAILLVVLVGVTLVSIELGKYLYSVYGA